MSIYLGKSVWIAPPGGRFAGTVVGTLLSTISVSLQRSNRCETSDCTFGAECGTIIESLPRRGHNARIDDTQRLEILRAESNSET